ncbi:hypothetical protein DE146DRAFT_614565 [Phaeosphaeria sp. MPI-PUGE-AT-0046c]|nr:hypothetical protein DE146DRAFT_614565 [Phaeosphaeria sp. MPI-PUGE-AT-0046c]
MSALLGCLALIAVCAALHWVPTDQLPLHLSQSDVLHFWLKWLITLWATIAVNSTLNSWAENKWLWKNDAQQWIWKREIAVVTGGAQGIGAHVVKRLLSHGITCAVLDVAPLSDCFTTDELEHVHHYQCNLASWDDIHRAAEAIRSNLGPPSILVNNAGIGNAYTILDIPVEHLRSLFDINLLSHWGTVKEFLPAMLGQGKGHIVSVASLASFVSLAGAVDYSCTKAALVSFHEGLAQEIKHRYKCPQIKTSIIHPGWTKSAITAHPAIRSGLESVGAKLLEADDVAKTIVDQIIAAKSGQIILGPVTAPKIRALPAWLQEIIRDSQAHVVTGKGTTA